MFNREVISMLFEQRKKSRVISYSHIYLKRVKFPDPSLSSIYKYVEHKNQEIKNIKYLKNYLINLFKY